jgi:hypothetical protein
MQFSRSHTDRISHFEITRKDLEAKRDARIAQLRAEVDTVRDECAAFLVADAAEHKTFEQALERELSGNVQAGLAQALAGFRADPEGCADTLGLVWRKLNTDCLDQLGVPLAAVCLGQAIARLDDAHGCMAAKDAWAWHVSPQVHVALDSLVKFILDCERPVVVENAIRDLRVAVVRRSKSLEPDPERARVLAELCTDASITRALTALDGARDAEDRAKKSALAAEGVARMSAASPPPATSANDEVAATVAFARQHFARQNEFRDLTGQPPLPAGEQ